MAEKLPLLPPFHQVSADGGVYFLEINPNCGVLYPPGQHGSADFILGIDPAASHAAFLDAIIEAALARRRGGQAAVVEAYVAGSGGYGLYAARDLAEGELLVKREGREHVLLLAVGERRRWWEAARQQMQQGMDLGDGRATQAAACPCVGSSLLIEPTSYPISDDVWAACNSSATERWLPNHSCDPNSWLDGLDLLARRPVSKGQQVTLDYATLYGPELVPQPCGCSSVGCRGSVGPRDYLLPALLASYGTHVSPYVAGKQGAAAATASGATAST